MTETPHLLIQHAWEQFRERFVAGENSPEQLEDVRRVFYFGAASAALVMNSADKQGDPEEKELVFSWVGAELEHFIASMVPDEEPRT